MEKFSPGDVMKILLSKKMVSVAGAVMVVILFIAACNATVGETKTQTVDTSTSTPPTVEVTGVVVTNSPEHNSFLKSEKGMAWQEALQLCGNYWAGVGLIAPGTQLNVDIVPDSSDPTNLEKMRLTFSIFGDPVYADVKCTMNKEQEDKFWETGNRDYLLPPPEDILKEYADPFCMGLVVKKGSSAEQAGVPIDSVFANRDGEWVYLDKDTSKVVGDINPETSQWQKVKDVIVQSETLLKSEKYPWFKGLDVSGLKIPDADTVVFDPEKVDLMISSYLKVIETQVPGVGEKNSIVDIYIPASEKLSSAGISRIFFKKMKIDVSKGLYLEIGDGNQANTIKISNGRLKNGSAMFFYYRINDDGSLVLGIGKSKFDGIKDYLGESGMGLYKSYAKTNAEGDFLTLLEMLGHVNEVGVDWRESNKGLYDTYYYSVRKTLGLVDNGKPFKEIVIDSALIGNYLIDSQE